MHLCVLNAEMTHVSSLSSFRANIDEVETEVVEIEAKLDKVRGFKAVNWPSDPSRGRLESNVRK